MVLTSCLSLCDDSTNAPSKFLQSSRSAARRSQTNMKKPRLVYVSVAAPLTFAFMSTLLIFCLKSRVGMILKAGIALRRTYASLGNYQVDGNKEMMAIGIMNIVGDDDGDQQEDEDEDDV